MAKQTTFKLPQDQVKPRSLLETFCGVLKKYGPRKQGHLAAQLGASESHLSEVLKGQKHIPEDWLRYVVEHYDFEGEIAACVAAWRGLEVRPPRVRPAAEKLRRLTYVLSQHNGLGKALRDEADALPDDVFADEEGP